MASASRPPHIVNYFISVCTIQQQQQHLQHLHSGGVQEYFRHDLRREEFALSRQSTEITEKPTADVFISHFLFAGWRTRLERKLGCGRGRPVALSGCLSIRGCFRRLSIQRVSAFDGLLWGYDLIKVAQVCFIDCLRNNSPQVVEEEGESRETICN